MATSPNIVDDPVFKDLLAKAAEDGLEAFRRTAILASDSRTGTLIAVGAASYCLQMILASTMAQIEVDPEEFLDQFIENFRINCLEKKVTFDGVFRDPEQVAKFQSQLPKYWTR